MILHPEWANDPDYLDKVIDLMQKLEDRENEMKFRKRLSSSDTKKVRDKHQDIIDGNR